MGDLVNDLDLSIFIARGLGTVAEDETAFTFLTDPPGDCTESELLVGSMGFTFRVRVRNADELASGTATGDIIRDVVTSPVDEIRGGGIRETAAADFMLLSTDSERFLFLSFFNADPGITDASPPIEFADPKGDRFRLPSPTPAEEHLLPESATGNILLPFPICV